MQFDPYCLFRKSCSLFKKALFDFFWFNHSFLLEESWSKDKTVESTLSLREFWNFKSIFFFHRYPDKTIHFNLYCFFKENYDQETIRSNPCLMSPYCLLRQFWSKDKKVQLILFLDRPSIETCSVKLLFFKRILVKR